MNNTSTNLSVTDLCVSGASISRCPWLTWVDCLVESLKPGIVTNHSCKGAGNQYIISSALHAANTGTNNKFLAVMLTNFDKYDMWVSGNVCQKLQGEKHPPHWINGLPTQHKGFWCTGSHFPLEKEIYLKNFFDLAVSASQNLTQALGLVKYCQDKNVPLLMMFDSPVLKYTEKQINDFCRHRLILEVNDLELDPLVAPTWSVLNSYVLDDLGLIGFCMEQELPWTSDRYGPHPPSSSHLEYFQQKIVPWIRKNYPHLQLSDLDEVFIEMVQRMTTKWQKKAF